MDYFFFRNKSKLNQKYIDIIVSFTLGTPGFVIDTLIDIPRDLLLR